MVICLCIGSLTLWIILWLYYLYIYIYYGDLSLYRVFDFMDYPLAALFIINNYLSLVILYCMCHELQ